ncbi:MAG TPA: mycofactocin biosynthesis glycosyltransferase MftF [Pseudonocardia sp.]
MSRSTDARGSADHVPRGGAADRAGGAADRAGLSSGHGPLPVGFTVRLDRRTRRLTGEDGRVALLGGSPMRLLRLAPVAGRLLDGPGEGPDGRPSSSADSPDTERHATEGTATGGSAHGRSLAVRDVTSAALAGRLLDTGVAHPAPDAPGAPAGPPPGAVTVVVPVRDRPGELGRLLAAVAETAPGVAEVIVVDDGSAEPLRCAETATVAGARLLRHERSRGPAAARNTGLAEARTELVAFLDSDVVPRAGWLGTLLGHLADPAVALAAPRIVGLPAGEHPAGEHPAGEHPPGWLDRYEGLRSSLDLGRDPAPVVPRSRVAYVPSAALLVRRAAVGAGFDPELRVAEDVDLGLRLHARGWRMRYEPAALVAHEHRVRPVGWWTRKAFYGTGAAPLAGRHPGSVPPAVLSPWTGAACLLLLAQRRAGLAGTAVVTVAAWVRTRRTLRGVHRPGRAAARLVGLGLLGALDQAAGLLTRHWWPLTVLGAVRSRRVRRAALAASVVEGLADWYDHRPRDGEPALDPVRYLLAHRADDLGYGAGLWWGVLRARDLGALLPTLTGLPRRRGRPATADARPAERSGPNE